MQAHGGVLTEWDKLCIWKLIGLSSLTTLLECAIYHPLWVLKTRQQLDKSLTVSHTKQTFALMHTLVREEGITRGLYRGFWPGTLGTIPPYSAYLVVYQFTKYSLARDPCPTFIQSTSPLIAGIIAEIIALGMYVPVDVVVQRMQLTHNVGKSALVVGRQVLHEEGLRGLFRGAFIAAQSYMLASATWWLVYEHTKCQSYRFYDRWFAQRQSRANDHDDVDASAPHGNVPRLLHPDIAHRQFRLRAASWRELRRP
eukprot:gnl/Spiro4/22382_TR11027_c0_g1_i1.p1 gnl/Spiro4/22382_TR11027_c0_g1~~gnl/Spiro4/22382_TR11027_c0_g1_i1.p1  ORF type:complete len:255 (+),score=27.35 gnl/Spiro4/22382_TR11027_c0_g1_i1:87-851(+)